MAMMGPQAAGGFQAPEPYVPESAKAAGALYEAGISPSDIEAVMQSQISNTEDFSNRRIFNEDDIALFGPLPQETTGPIPTAAEPAPFDPVAYRNQFKPDSGGLASVAQPTPTVVPPQTQQMPNFYQQPMGMMPQSFNPMGYGPMGMGMNRFMNPYGGGLGGIAYNFMNRPMPLYGQGGQFIAGEYKAPKPIAPTQPYGSFSYY